MKILIAEDHADIRKMLRMLLETRGHTVDIAGNGQEAVSAALQNRPDVIVMDVRMPVMDGIRATRVLRSRPDTKDLPVICMSAFLDEEYSMADAFNAGCFACLTKPIEWKKFEELLGPVQQRNAQAEP